MARPHWLSDSFEEEYWEWHTRLYVHNQLRRQRLWEQCRRRTHRKSAEQQQQRWTWLCAEIDRRLDARADLLDKESIPPDRQARFRRMTLVLYCLMTEAMTMAIPMLQERKPVKECAHTGAPEGDLDG